MPSTSPAPGTRSRLGFACGDDGRFRALGESITHAVDTVAGRMPMPHKLMFEQALFLSATVGRASGCSERLRGSGSQE